MQLNFFKCTSSTDSFDNFSRSTGQYNERKCVSKNENFQKLTKIQNSLFVSDIEVEEQKINESIFYGEKTVFASRI